MAPVTRSQTSKSRRVTTTKTRAKSTTTKRGTSGSTSKSRTTSRRVTTSKTTGRKTTSRSVSRSRSAASGRRRAPAAAASRSRSASAAGSRKARSRPAAKSRSSRGRDASTSSAAAKKPKRAMTAYQAFVQTQLKNKKMDRGQFAAKMKELGDKWRSMSDSEKAKYKARATRAARQTGGATGARASKQPSQSSRRRR